MGLFNSSRHRQTRHLKTIVEKDNSEWKMPASAKEIFATLDRLTRPIIKGTVNANLQINLNHGKK